MKRVRITLSVSRQEYRPEAPLEVGCADCGASLEVHQPDMSLPERLLGTCEQCGAWYLVVCRASRLDVVIMRMPEDAAIDQAAERLRLDVSANASQDMGESPATNLEE